jgi:uncharacterized membrane protein
VSILLSHVVSTITMFGVILVVQLVHYPLFAQVGEATYEAYQSEHMRRITWIVLPAMTVELVTAVWLVVDPVAGLPAWQTWTGLALVGVIWAATGLLQVPQHARLTSGFDAAAHRRLLASNWIRTLAWTLRTALVTWMLTHAT